MPKVKKSRRRFHDHRKNMFRRTSKGYFLDELRKDIKSCPTSINVGWVANTDIPEIIQLSYLCSGMSHPPFVSKYLTIYSDMTWDWSIMKRKVSDSVLQCHLLPLKISNFNNFKCILLALDESSVCTGNSDKGIIEILKARFNGTLKDTSESFIDESGTIRHQSCTLVLDRTEVESNTKRCKICHNYRNSLRALCSKQRKSKEDKPNTCTTHNSHANYRWLNEYKMRERLKSVQSALKTLRRSKQRLEDKLLHLITKYGVDFNDSDTKDIEELLDGSMQGFDQNSFQNIFFQQQKKYNMVRNKKNMRWHPVMIRFALSIKYQSTAAYNTLGKFFKLPSSRLLRDYTHYVKFKTGTDADIIDCFKKEVTNEGFQFDGLKIGLLIDEIKVKSGLVFHKSTGTLVGFVNLGEANNDMMLLEQSLQKPTIVTKKEIATHMLVLMSRIITKPSSTFPIAQFPSANMSGGKLYSVVWDTVQVLELNGLHVVSITCDGASANRSFFHISAEKCTIPYRTQNPYRPSDYIYFFCDVPHLIKTTRNCMYNSFCNSKSRQLTVSCIILTVIIVNEVKCHF